MAKPNRQRLERNHVIIVTLEAGNRASIAIRRPTGDNMEPPVMVDLSPLIAGGLAETDALERVLEIVAVGVRVAVGPNI